jgi:hypothetical protein
MSDPEQQSVELPDNSCERCSLPRPRLIFDQLSELLIYETCLERVQQQQSWSLLRETETI